MNKEVGMFPRCRKPISEGESGQAGDRDLWVTGSAIKLNSGKWTGSDWMDRTRLRPQGDSTGGPSNKCGPVCDRTRAQPRRSPRLSGTGWDRQNVQALKRAFAHRKFCTSAYKEGRIIRVWCSRFVQVVFAGRCACRQVWSWTRSNSPQKFAQVQAGFVGRVSRKLSFVYFELFNYGVSFDNFGYPGNDSLDGGCGGTWQGQA